MILGIAVTDTDAFAYAAGITLANPSTVIVSLAAAVENVASAAD